MNTIDSRLNKQISTEPRRSLHTTFTDDVMDRIKLTDQHRYWAWIGTPFRRISEMYHLTKPATAAVVGFILVVSASTAFAAVQFVSNNPAPVSAPSTRVASSAVNSAGNTRVAITLTGCEEGTGNTFTSNKKVYYDIRKGSSLTADGLKTYLQAICEGDYPHLLFPYVSLTQEQYEAAWGPNGTHIQNNQYNVTVDSISSDALYITIKSNYDLQTYHNVRIPISPDVKVYQDMQPISIQDIKPGKDLVIIVQTNSLSQQITADNLTLAQQAALAPQGIPLGSNVVGIMQRSYPFADAEEGYRTMGKDWTALVPDASAPDGYRELVKLK